jgi:adenine-specific DNA methylase
MSVEPFAWRDRPSLIERVLPSQKISAEAQKERKAGAGQTLTALGSYWKGRKPLILVKACVLGALLPATNNSEADLAIFEKLMAIDDEAFLRRGFRPSCLDLVKRLLANGWMNPKQAENLFEVRRRERVNSKTVWEVEAFLVADLDALENDKNRRLAWSDRIDNGERHRWEVRWVQSFDYLERVSGAKRPEELDQEELFAPIWDAVNAHLGTSASGIPELVEQLGILRFGHRPKVGDTFCGGGSIPFEAARLGCDVYASDLNPIACMLTWGAFNIIGASANERKRIEAAQRAAAEAVDRQIAELGVEHDNQGNRAKAFLYCLEVKCPQTEWMIPVAPSWIISNTRNVIARLVPDHDNRRFDIQIESGVSSDAMKQAATGTEQDGHLVYQLDGETYRTDLRTIRGDYRLSNGSIANRLRRWEKEDVAPRQADILQERLYCVQWLKRETFGKSRPETFFASVTDEDVDRESKVERLVCADLANWQARGLVSDMAIEPGEKTDEPIRTRGWTHWHHLFNPRQINALRLLRHKSLDCDAATIAFSKVLDYSSRLCRWDAGHSGSSPQSVGTFTNQALNTLSNYACKSTAHLIKIFLDAVGQSNYIPGAAEIHTISAPELHKCSDFFITDPPYADAIQYHEITEFFISWLRAVPPNAFREWIWDSRRALAIKGSEDDLRRDMITAYGAMARHSPDNSLQISMFVHQDAGVWADMAAIVWGAGLQVTAAWYIATETTSELKKGGYVQGTVLLVLRKRLNNESVYRDELVQEVRREVAKQIETMVGLNQSTKGHGRTENLFEDADLQMAGYAAALRVLTGYTRIDGQDMAAEAVRPRPSGGRDVVKEIIDFAVQVANEHLVPEGFPPSLWERITGPERFYLKMLDLEAAGLKKIDNYQNFAKAFRFRDYGSLMESSKPNDARLKSALELKRAEFESEFGKGMLRAVLFALYEIERETDIDEVMEHLRDLVAGYLNHREDLMAIAGAIASRRATRVPEEAQAARILSARIKNERLG